MNLKTQRIKNILALILFVLALSGCYKESSLIPLNSQNIFYIDMPDTTMKHVLESRDERFYLLPTPQLYFDQNAYKVDHIKTRGASALKFQRKSYSVNLDDYIALENAPGQTRLFEKFKLISMVFDYTYIENRLSHILLSKIDLWPLHSFYTEVVFNRKHHQGLYLFVEDPEEYAIYQKDAEVIMRRYYENVISDIELHSSIDQNLENDYIKDFTQIYTIITQYQGEQLYNKLAHKLNITNYMRKMALDYIIKNGDYTDEIYFYGSTKNDTIYYEIIPWDYDDIFAEQAHEIGRAIFVGKKFGERQYNNKEELEEAINGRLVFSIEDDIDYIITNDDYLYSKYLNELQYVLSVIDEHTIKSAFSQVKSELDEFYKNDEIIAQSVYDEQETNNSLYESNFEQKQSYLINRVNNIAIKLNQQISEFKNEY